MMNDQNRQNKVQKFDNYISLSLRMSEQLHSQDIPNMQQLESRLKKFAFLTKTSLPGYADACILTILQQNQKIPNKTSYPNLYHWYILMLQFSTNSIQKWIIKGPDQNDNLIEEIIKHHGKAKQKQEGKLMNLVTSPLKMCKSTDYQPDNQKLKKKFSLDHYQPQYIIDIKIKEGVDTSIESVIKACLSKEKIDLLKFTTINDNPQQIQIRIHFKIDATLFEGFKDRVTKWPAVQNIQIKKQRKQYNKYFHP